MSTLRSRYVVCVVILCSGFRSKDFPIFASHSDTLRSRRLGVAA